MTGGRSPLEGIRVADFTWVIVGNTTTRYLSEFGATVVRVESHKRPDTIRFTSPFKDGIPGVDRSTYGAEFMCGKMSISLDLTLPKGKAVAFRLITEWADVVAEGWTPGTMAKLGLGYEQVKKVRPDIVYYSASIQGQTGPHASLGGYGYQAGALAGISYVTGWPDREPSQPWGAVTDYFAPRIGAAAILAALDYRRRTGKGQHIDLSQTEAGIQLLAPAVLDYTVNGRTADRQGNGSPRGAPHGVFRCKGEDRWCAVTVFTDKQWKSFRKAIGAPPWTGDPRFSTVLARKENEGELEQLVLEWSVRHSAEEIMNALQSVGVPAGIAQSVKDLFSDPQLKERDHFRWFEHSAIGSHVYHAPTFKLSRTPDQQSAGPCLGQHNEYVLKTLLGLSDDEIADLLIEGVITTEADIPQFRGF